MDLNHNTYTNWLENFPKSMQLEISEIFITTMKEDRERLRRQSGNIASTLRAVHKIKGGSDQIGLERVSVLAERVEKLEESKTDELNDLITLLDREISNSITHIQYWQSQQDKHRI